MYASLPPPAVLLSLLLLTLAGFCVPDPCLAQVTSVTGTANQVTASPTTGAVVVGLPVTVKIPSGSSSGASLQLPASTTSAASLNVASSTASPTTPNSGDVWNLSGVLSLYAGGTQNILTDGGTTLSSTQIASVSATNENQLVTGGPTITGSANIENVGSIVGSGDATFTALLTAPGSGAGVGSIQFFTTGSSPAYSVTVTPAAAPTANFTLSLPNIGSNDALASLTATQTFTNTTLSDALFVDGANSNATLFTTSGVPSAINYWQIGNSATGTVQMSAAGSSSNINAAVSGKGTGSALLYSDGKAALAATNTSTSAVNFAGVNGSVSGSPVVYTAGGSDPNISVAISPKGSGAIILSAGVVRSGASSSDLAGQLTLSGGMATYSFTGTYANAPICVANDTTAANAVKVSVNTTTLTVTGTGTDGVDYICIGRN